MSENRQQQDYIHDKVGLHISADGVTVAAADVDELHWSHPYIRTNATLKCSHQQL